MRIYVTVDIDENKTREEISNALRECGRVVGNDVEMYGVPNVDEGRDILPKVGYACVTTAFYFRSE